MSRISADYIQAANKGPGSAFSPHDSHSAFRLHKYHSYYAVIARLNSLEWNNHVIEGHFGQSEKVDAKDTQIVFPLESKFAAEYASLANVAGFEYSTREH